jgi:hypothetical protein
MHKLASQHDEEEKIPCTQVTESVHRNKNIAPEEKGI